MKRLLIALALACVCQLPGKVNASSEEAFLKAQFQGWDGLALRCEVSPESDWLKSLCGRADQRARLLAASINVKYNYSAEKSYILWMSSHFDKGLRDPLTLLVDIHAAGSDSMGVSIKVSAEKFYTDAVELGETKNSPEGNPKSGTLVLWDRTFIGSGAKGPELKLGMVEALESVMSEFFAIYAEHRK